MRVGVAQHAVFHRSELITPLLNLQVCFIQLPLAQGIKTAPVEASLLLIPTDTEVEFDQDGPLLNQVILEATGTLDEVSILLGATEPEHGFHHGAAIPTGIEQHHFASTG